MLSETTHPTRKTTLNYSSVANPKVNTGSIFAKKWTTVQHPKQGVLLKWLTLLQLRRLKLHQSVKKFLIQYVLTSDGILPFSRTFNEVPVSSIQRCFVFGPFQCPEHGHFSVSELGTCREVVEVNNYMMKILVFENDWLCERSRNEVAISDQNSPAGLNSR